MSYKYGGQYCCVVGCSNSQYKDGKNGIKFFSFPGNQEQKELWIKAVKRENADGTLWRPTKHSKICSAHFFGNVKSKNSTSPSFSPSIFPTKHCKEQSVSDAERFNRRLNRKPIVVETVKPEKVEIGIQVDIVECSKQNFSFECDFISQTEKCTGTTSAIETTKTIPKKFNSCGTNTDDKREMLNNYKHWNERQFKAFTGIAENLFKFLLFKTGKNTSTKLSDEESLLLLLMKLKLNLSFAVLASHFNVSEKTARRCFYLTLDLVYEAVKDYIVWLDKSTIQARLPASFKALFPNARVIIDASEIECQRPSTQHQRVQMYSNYKSRFTVKFLLGIAPSGEITFVSKAFGGRTTDTEITIKSGFIDLIEPGDVVLADKGFPHIETNLANNGGVLVMPPFKSGSKQFSEQENKSGYQIASVRIHVERCIARLKVFEILNFLPTHMLAYIDKILVILSFINNCSPDLIRQ